MRHYFQKAYRSQNPHTCTSSSLPLLDAFSSVVSPSPTLMLPSLAAHSTQPSFSRTVAHRSLGEEFCRWQRRHIQPCQLAEVLKSDKKGTSADCTPISLFWAKHFILSLQSSSRVNLQMFFATCITFPSQ